MFAESRGVEGGIGWGGCMFIISKCTVRPGFKTFSGICKGRESPETRRRFLHSDRDVSGRWSSFGCGFCVDVSRRLMFGFMACQMRRACGGVVRR